MRRGLLLRSRSRHRVWPRPFLDHIVELVDERAGLNEGRHTGLDGGNDHGISRGHAISLNRHKTGDSSGGGYPLQLLFADRFRPTSTCCPLANRTQGPPEPSRLQATPEFGAVLTATAPLVLKEQIIRVERTLPRLEHVGSPATQRLPNEIATTTQPANNLLDRHAVPGKRHGERRKSVAKEAEPRK